MQETQQFNIPEAGHPVAQHRVVHAAADVDRVELDAAVVCQRLRHAGVGHHQTERPQDKRARLEDGDGDRGRQHATTPNGGHFPAKREKPPGGASRRFRFSRAGARGPFAEPRGGKLCLAALGKRPVVTPPLRHRRPGVRFFAQACVLRFSPRFRRYSTTPRRTRLTGRKANFQIVNGAQFGSIAQR